MIKYRKENEMNQKLSLKSDYIFKMLFGKKGNESILKDFLTAILNIEIEKVEVIQDARLEKTAREQQIRSIRPKSNTK